MSKPLWDELMVKRNGLKRGSQVAYIPHHAHGNIDHEDVEYGFVTSVKKLLGIAYVRYFWKQYPDQLRNTTNSEGTLISDLYPIDHRSQEVIDKLLEGCE